MTCDSCVPGRKALVIGAICSLAVWFGLPAAACAQEDPDVQGIDDYFDLGDEYDLDDVPRTVPARGRFRCPEADLVSYRGDVLRYSSTLRVHRAFKERLRLFEEVVRDVAVEIYGRAPRRILHKGTYNCRRIRRFPDMMSEHGLGNAIDIAGFEFGRARKREPLPEGAPRRLRRSFEVQVAKHWNAKGTIGTVHRTFLRTLARRLIERQHIFRVLLGPAWPGHGDHFHFDCSNYRLVAIFEDEG